MPYPKHCLHFILLFSLLCGCDFLKAPAPYHQTDPEKKLVEILKRENEIHVITKTVENTVWIYVPFKEPIFDIKANPKEPKEDDKQKKKYLILYLNGDFETNNFHFQYDIVMGTKQIKDYGYGTRYKDNVSKIQQNIYAAINRVYFDIEKIPGEREFSDAKRQSTREKFIDAHLKRPKAPEFFVITLSDIINGIEIETIFNLEDYKKFSSGALPYEENLQRTLSDSRGGPSIIDDGKGDHLKYRAISWDWFLAKQIQNRIRFKYEQSDFPPNSTPEDTILKIIDDTVSTYQFDKFESIRLDNLRENKNYSFSRAQVFATNP